LSDFKIRVKSGEGKARSSIHDIIADLDSWIVHYIQWRSQLGRVKTNPKIQALEAARNILATLWGEPKSGPLP
jgi:hypothetical protein